MKTRTRLAQRDIKKYNYSMKKYAIFIIISLLIFTNANAKWKYKPGDIVQGEVVFSKKDSFKLPPGEFIVALNTRENEFKDLMLYQIDDKSGYTRWSIHFFATGSTKWEWWNPPDFCKRTNVYFIQKKIANKKYACWMVNHSRSDIGANKGFWAKVREYEIANKIKGPDIYVYSQYEYSKGPKVWGASYYYNPELDGIPKPESKEWDTNEFHKQRVMNYPKHEEFLKKYISISAGFVDAFREINQEAVYTWWSNRGQAYANNVGWRLDYQVITPGLVDSIRDAWVYNDERFSDHAPFIMDYDGSL